MSRNEESFSEKEGRTPLLILTKRTVTIRTRREAICRKNLQTKQSWKFCPSPCWWKKAKASAVRTRKAIKIRRLARFFISKFNIAPLAGRLLRMREKIVFDVIEDALACCVLRFKSQLPFGT